MSRLNLGPLGSWLSKWTSFKQILLALTFWSKQNCGLGLISSRYIWELCYCSMLLFLLIDLINYLSWINCCAQYFFKSFSVLNKLMNSSFICILNPESNGIFEYFKSEITSQLFITGCIETFFKSENQNSYYNEYP